MPGIPGICRTWLAQKPAWLARKLAWLAQEFGGLQQVFLLCAPDAGG